MERSPAGRLCSCAQFGRRNWRTRQSPACIANALVWRSYLITSGTVNAVHQPSSHQSFTMAAYCQMTAPGFEPNGNYAL